MIPLLEGVYLSVSVCLNALYVIYSNKKSVCLDVSLNMHVLNVTRDCLNAYYVYRPLVITKVLTIKDCVSLISRDNRDD